MKPSQRLQSFKTTHLNLESFHCRLWETNLHWSTAQRSEFMLFVSDSKIHVNCCKHTCDLSISVYVCPPGLRQRSCWWPAVFGMCWGWMNDFNQLLCCSMVPLVFLKIYAGRWFVPSGQMLAAVHDAGSPLMDAHPHVWFTHIEEWRALLQATKINPWKRGKLVY